MTMPMQTPLIKKSKMHRPDLDQICQGLGFRLLGIVSAQYPQDGTDCQIALIGNIGDEFWPFFIAAPEYTDGLPNRLDRYCRRTLTEQAPERARLIMPSDAPYAPFQSWAQSLGTMHPSPLGILIHQNYGLWFAFRAAWRFPADTFDFDLPVPTPSPCQGCIEKPCLNSCPVSAFSTSGLAADTCRNYLTSAPSPCIGHQCQARLACPIGAEHRYQSGAGPFFLKNFACLD